MKRFLSAVLLGSVALSGCDLFDPVHTDPNVARIDAVSVASAPAEVQSHVLFVRLGTRSETTDTEAAAGPFPLALATRSEVDVVTTDGRFEGEALSVELRRCSLTCSTSEVVGRATVEPDGWPGSERTVDVGTTRVTLVYRKTTS